jgi:hypothetical protein
MIALVMTVCLLASPGGCHEERLLLDVPKMTCDIMGQMAVTEWRDAHPGYRVVPGYRCEAPMSRRPT